MNPVSQLASLPVCQFRVKDYLLCISSAFLLIFSFPNFNIWLLAWVGFVPLFFALQNKSKRRAFFLAYLTGIIFWFGAIYWLVHVTLAGLILLVLYLALYFGILGWIFAACGLQPVARNLFFIPSVWVLLEYIRSHLFSGFPWLLLGYSQYLNLPIIQIADITGAWGVSFLVMLVNVAIYQVSRSAGHQVTRRNGIVSIIIILITLIYGYYRINHRPLAIDHRPLKISVIQGNIPQELKWNPQSKEYIINKYLEISRRVSKDEPNLIIWPEAALPAPLEAEPFDVLGLLRASGELVKPEPIYFTQVKDLAREIKTPLLLGAVTLRDNFYFNSALLVSAEGNLLNQYDKLHLVPFGEYIPLRKVLPFLETVVPIGDFAAGREYTVFKQVTRSPGHQVTSQFSVLICFEDLFPELSREFVRRGADFLINITNDAWFKKTSSPYQHLCASVFRAVENRVPVVRAANTGVSGFIAPRGRIISLVQDELGRNIFIDGYKTEEIYLGQRDLSFYTQYGDIFILFCLIFQTVLLSRIVTMRESK